MNQKPIMKVVGMKKGRFVDDKTGQLVEFGRLYVSGESVEKDTVGCVTEWHKCNHEMLEGIAVGDILEQVLYNQYKKPVMFITKKNVK